MSNYRIVNSVYRCLGGLGPKERSMSNCQYTKDLMNNLFPSIKIVITSLKRLGKAFTFTWLTICSFTVISTDINLRDNHIAC